MAETIEIVDSTNDTEGQDVTIDPTLTGEDRTKAIETALAATTEKNKKLFARAKKAEGFELDESTKKWVKKEKPAPQINNQNDKPQPLKPTDILDSDEFQLHDQGYTPKEIKLIMANGGMKILEEKENPLVVGLQAAQEQRRAEGAADRANGSSNLSEAERKYTPEQLRNMKPDEIAKIIGWAQK